MSIHILYMVNFITLLNIFNPFPYLNEPEKTATSYPSVIQNSVPCEIFFSVKSIQVSIRNNIIIHLSLPKNDD